MRVLQQFGVTIAGIVSGVLVVAGIEWISHVIYPLPQWSTGIGGCLLFGLIGLLLAAPNSYTVSTSRTIVSPFENVVGTWATVEEFATAIPNITKVELLSDKKQGQGTRFRETRLMNGKEANNALEITEFVENRLVRSVSEAGGTIWDTIFQVEKSENQTEMSKSMDASPKPFFANFSSNYC